MNPLPNIVLRAASWLVPAEDRADWLAEWRSELCYLRGSASSLGFCLGAIPDAWWIRRNAPSSAKGQWLRLSSPVHCLLFLAALTGASTFAAFHLPAARDLLLPLPYPDAQDLTLVAAPGHFGETLPTISTAGYRSIAHWMTAAFYHPQKSYMISGSRPVRISVARASSNLFELIGLPVAAPVPSVILSDAAFRKYFGAGRRIAGRTVQLDGRNLPLAAILNADQWRLPGRFDAWIVEGREGLAGFSPQALGYVITRRNQSYRSWHWELLVPNAEGKLSYFECTPLAHQQPFAANLLVLGIAVLLVPLLMSFDQARYRNRTMPARRWIFLAAKLALLLPAVYFVTLNMASIIAVGLQPHAMLIGYVLAFRWALLDQRRRCPVCLRLLTNPTQIGRSSQTFLEWWGTELMCAQGHGLMYVPALPQSSSSTQHWLTLEESWSSLFS